MEEEREYQNEKGHYVIKGGGRERGIFETGKIPLTVVFVALRLFGD